MNRSAGWRGFLRQRAKARRTRALVSGGSAKYAARKSAVVEEFIQGFGPAGRDVLLGPFQRIAQPPPGSAVPGNRRVPFVQSSGLELGQPAEEFVKLVRGQGLDLASKLLNGSSHS